MKPKATVRRIYKLKPKDRDLITETRKDLGIKWEDLLRKVGATVNQMKVDTDYRKRVNVGLDFPPEVFDAINTKAKKTGVPMIKIILQAIKKIRSETHIQEELFE